MEEIKEGAFFDDYSYSDGIRNPLCNLYNWFLGNVLALCLLGYGYIINIIPSDSFFPYIKDFFNIYLYFILILIGSLFITSNIINIYNVIIDKEKLN